VYWLVMLLSNVRSLALTQTQFKNTDSILFHCYLVSAVLDLLSLVVLRLYFGELLVAQDLPSKLPCYLYCRCFRCPQHKLDIAFLNVLDSVVGIVTRLGYSQTFNSTFSYSQIMFD